VEIPLAWRPTEDRRVRPKMTVTFNGG
jgi:hypothetical protein